MLIWRQSKINILFIISFVLLCSSYGLSLQKKRKVIDILMTVELGKSVSSKNDNLYYLNLLKNTENCLNSALVFAEVTSYKFNLMLKRINILQKKDEKRLSTAWWNFNRDLNGNRITFDGSQTNHHFLVISDRIRQAFVQRHVPSSIEGIELEIWTNILKQGQLLEQLIKQGRDNDLTAIESAKKIFHLQLVKPLRPFDNKIMIPGSFGIDPKVLAHELMHSWGGLDEAYLYPSSNQDNLMGSHGSCKLTHEQFKTILNYRKYGVPQSKNDFELSPLN